MWARDFRPAADAAWRRLTSRRLPHLWRPAQRPTPLYLSPEVHFALRGCRARARMRRVLRESSPRALPTVLSAESGGIAFSVPSASNLIEARWSKTRERSGDIG